MEDIWRRIEAWLETNAPHIIDTLRAGASDDRIRAAEEFLSVKFPEDVVASYRIHDGQTDEIGMIDGYSFLSLEHVRQGWQRRKDALDRGDFEGLKTDPEAGVRDDWWNPGWIPITSNEAGDHFCLDMAPGEGGRVGQVIGMIHDDGPRNLLAPSFRDWLARYADGLEAGQYVYSEEYDEVIRADEA